MQQAYRVIVGLLLACSLQVSVAWAYCQVGASQTEATHTIFQHACYEFYFNNAGAAVSSGSVVVLDLTGTGVNTIANASRNSASRSNMADVDGSDGDVTNIGTYITTTTTADSELVVGVVDDDSCADQSYCRVQTYGPRMLRCAQSTDAVVAGDAIGTTTLAGQAGDAAANADGTLGIALTTGTSADNALCYAFIKTVWTD